MTGARYETPRYWSGRSESIICSMLGSPVFLLTASTLTQLMSLSIDEYG